MPARGTKGGLHRSISISGKEIGQYVPDMGFEDGIAKNICRTANTRIKTTNENGEVGLKKAKQVIRQQHRIGIE